MDLDQRATAVKIFAEAEEGFDPLVCSSEVLSQCKSMLDKEAVFLFNFYANVQESFISFPSLSKL